MIDFTDIEKLKKIYSTCAVSIRGNFIKKYANRKDSIRDIIIKYVIPNLTNQTILDIGPGNGSFLEKLSLMYPDNRYCALDIIKNENFSSSKDIQFFLYDGNEFPFACSEKFNLIFCMHMLYHVLNMTSFFAEVQKFLKSDGKVIITTKSIHTLCKIEKIFLEIVDEMGIDGIYDKRDERVFCRENAELIIRQHFHECRDKLKIYDIKTQLIVDNMDDLLTYIFSTMRYNLVDKLPANEYRQYQCLWLDKISKYKIFLDEVIECILVLTKEQE